jgi:hypothetical protein
MNDYLEPFKTSGYILLSIVLFIGWAALVSGPLVLFVAGASVVGNGEMTLPFVTSGWWMLSLLAYFVTIPLALAIETTMGWTMFRMEK